MDSTTRHQQPNYDLQGATVLIADDDPVIRFIFHKYLSRWNAQVNVVGNGVDALESVQQNRYDVVLMDLEMPGMSGFESTACIRQLEGSYFKELPVLAMTASRFADVKAEISRCGMTDFIDKVFDPERFYLKLCSYIPHILNART